MQPNTLRRTRQSQAMPRPGGVVDLCWSVKRLNIKSTVERVQVGNLRNSRLAICATPKATRSFRIEGYMFVFDGAIRCRPCLLTQCGGAFYVRRRDADDAIHYRR